MHGLDVSCMETGKKKGRVGGGIMLEHKGYVGKIAYDDVAEVLYARVINSGSCSIAEAEATDVESVKREFRKSVDLYLDSCAEDGVEPVPPTEAPVETQATSG